MKTEPDHRAAAQAPPGKRGGLLAEKNGLKSILRTPKKTVLFFVLLATLITLFTLVVCVYHAVSGYLDECNAYYHSVAELQYIGQAYPDSHADDPALRQSLAENADTLAALLELPGVIQYDAEDALLGVIPGLTRHDYQVYDRDAAVIAVRITWWDSTNASYAALVSGVYYAWDDVIEKICYVALDEGTLQPGETYVMCGHFITSANNFLLFQPEDAAAGAQTIPGWQQIESEDLPDDSPYRSLAQVFANRNNGYRVSPVTDLETLRPWQQGELKLIGGRLFTEAEYAQNAQVCVISNLLSTVLELSVGDTIQLSLNDCENRIYASWCETLAPSSTYTITGIYYRTEEHPDTLYIPRSAPVSQVQMTAGYTLGQFRLDNDQARAFMTAADALLPPSYRLTLYDEGYESVSGPYRELQNLSLLFLLICFLVVAGTLALYSYLFISRRREAALLQRALGAGNAHVLRGFLAASLAVTLPAAVLGFAAARLLEGNTLQYVQTLAERFGAADIRFSSANLFTVRHLAFAPVSDTGVYLLTGGLFLIAVLLFTAAFSADAVRERKPRKKKKPRAVHGHTSRLSGRLKYAFLSIRRGGMRTLSVLLLCAIIAAFLGLLTSASDQYALKLKEIEDNTVIRGYVTDLLGRYRDGMVIPAKKAQALLESGLLNTAALSWQVSNLRLIGVTRTANGTMTDLQDPFIPTGGFAVETLQYKLSHEPKWIAANSLSGAPAFYFEDNPNIAWLNGYDESCLSGPEGDLCVLPEDMLLRNGVQLGDTVRFLCWYEEGRDAYFALFDFLVVGSYELPSGAEIIYTPLGFAFPPGAEATQVPQRAYRSEQRWAGGYDLAWSPMQLSKFRFRSMIFTLRSTADLDLLRDTLAAIPFAETGSYQSVRDYALVDDADFVSATQGMQRQIRYMNALFLCLYVAVMLIGAVGAYLLQNARKAEIALMRALGVGSARIVLSFLFEQLLLSLSGIGLGVLLWRAAGGSTNALFLWLTAIYECCWMTGSLIRILRALRMKAQELLTEPE